MCTVTVGLCVKNSARTVKRAIESIALQDFPLENVEVIVVDGNSKDATIDIVKTSISESHIKSTVYSDQGKGLGLARQIVVDNACCKYIVYIGDDVVLPSNFLRLQVDFMEKNPQIAAAIPENEHDSSQKSIVANVQNLLFSVAQNVSNGTLFRTEALREINGFDPRIKGASEDRDVIIRVKKAGWTIANNSQAKFHHGREEKLKDVHIRYFWYGYGSHFINHKHDSLHDFPFYLPPAYVAWGVKLSAKAYAKYQEKKSFLIPSLCLIASMSWCLGFFIAHTEGYGHQKS